MISLILETFYVMLPVIVIVSIGFLCGKFGWIKKQHIAGLSKIIFYFGLPALLIDELSKIDSSKFLDMKGHIVLIVVAITTGFIGYVVAKLYKKPDSHIGVWAQGAFRSEMTFIGLPIANAVLGNEGIGYSILILVVGIPLYNFLAIFYLYLPHHKGLSREALLKLSKEVALNPLILSVVVGFLFSFVRPEKTPILDELLHVLKQIPLPLALLLVGVTLKIRESFIRLKEITPVAILKLIFMPLLAGLLLYLMGASKEDFIITVILIASPVALISHVMALEMNGDQQLAVDIIVSTGFLGFITMTVTLFILGLLGIWTPTG